MNLLNIAGRPWAIDADLAAHVRGVLERQGIAGLRALAAAKAAAHSADEHAGRPRPSATVGVVPIVGLLTHRGDVVESVETRSSRAIADEVKRFASDARVNGLLLDIDSGGGEVFGIPEAWSAIQAATKVKPVVASINAFAGSAAYWLASAATEIVATPSALVGSIGVYSLHVDSSKALEQAGEKWTFVSAGKYKVEGNPAQPLGDEARADMQAEVDSFYRMFVQDVARGRGIGAERVRGPAFGEGRMVNATSAVARGMADRVGTIDEAAARVSRLATGGAPTRALASAPDPKQWLREDPQGYARAKLAELEAEDRKIAIDRLRASL